MDRRKFLSGSAAAGAVAVRMGNSQSPVRAFG